MQAAKPVEVVVFELRSILCCCCCSCKVLFGSQLACSAGGSNTFLASSSLRLRLLLLFIKAGGEWVEGAPVSLPLTSITDAMDAVRDLVRDLLGGAMGSIWVDSAESSGSSGRRPPGPPPRGTGRGSRSCGG